VPALRDARDDERETDRSLSMPGPISDSYDPEWGTAENARRIRVALAEMYEFVSAILGGRPPMFILDLVDQSLPMKVPTTLLTEKEWRLIRFALERARDSI
jgi:hypothetical protein